MRTSPAAPVLGAAALITASLVAAAPPPQIPFGNEHSVGKADDGGRVNISLSVMSRCPDARLCENVFGDVLRTDSILDKVSLSMHYIGTTNSSAPLGVTCKHGPAECLGNAHQLCWYEHLSLKQFVAAVECQNFPSSFPEDIGTVEFAKQCTETVGADWWESGVGECVEGKKKHGEEEEEVKGEYRVGKEGKKLLQENVKETEKTGITTSCTIQIDSTLVGSGQRTCVVDGGVWRGCDDGHTAPDFVRVIEAEWKNLKSKEAEQ
ncbi:hypothetical protein IAT38_004850 [Cryptococcus sp. DSM 104549]